MRRTLRGVSVPEKRTGGPPGLDGRGSDQTSSNDTCVDANVAGVEQLRTALEAAGRDPASLMVRAPLPIERDGKRPDLVASLGHAGALEKAGVTEVSVPTSVVAKDLEGLPAAMAELAGRWAER